LGHAAVRFSEIMSDPAEPGRDAAFEWVEIVNVGESDAKSGSYQWRDDSAESGKTYWYSIGVINRNGSRQDLTGAQKVTAK